MPASASLFMGTADTRTHSTIVELGQASALKLLAPELNMAQFVVLNHLARRATSASLVSMASAIKVTKGAMTNTVSRLEEKGYVSVEKDASDGRGKQVSLTNIGRSVREDAVKKCLLICKI